MDRDPPPAVGLDCLSQEVRESVEDKIHDALFDSWQSVLDLVAARGIGIEEIVHDVRQSDRSAGDDAVAAFIWGVARALKAGVKDPSTAAGWIASGLQDFSCPNSRWNMTKEARGYGELAGLLLRRWSFDLAIVGDNLSAGVVGDLLHIARVAGGLRGQAWDAVLLTRTQGADAIPVRSYEIADVEFSGDLGWCRVKRSSVAGRPGGSSPAVYVVSCVEEGVAVLDFEMVSLCISLSGPDAAVFAHPTIGIYAKQTRGGSRLVRTAALETCDGRAEESGPMLELTKRMIEMYADMRISGFDLNAEEIGDLGGSGIGGAGMLTAIMRLAYLVAQ